MVLTVGQAIVAILEGCHPHLLLSQMRPIAFYLTYFLILGSFKHEKDLIQFIRLLIVIGIISVGVIYFQTLTGGLSSATKVDYRTDYHIYQSVNEAMFAVACTFLLLFSATVGKKGEIFTSLSSKVALLWMAGALLLTLVRQIWVTTSLGMAVIILLNKKFKRYAIILLLTIAFLGIVGHIVERITGSESFSFIISDRILTGVRDIRGLSNRTEMMLLRWNYMIKENPIMGHGFRVSRVDLLKDQYFIGSTKYDPTALCGHTMVGDVAARYGLTGFFLFGWLMFTALRKATRLFRTLPPSWQKSLVCGLLAFNIQAVVISIVGSPYLNISGIIVLAPSWAVLELIERFHKRDQNRTLTSGEAQ